MCGVRSKCDSLLYRMRCFPTNKIAWLKNNSGNYLRSKCKQTERLRGMGYYNLTFI